MISGANSLVVLRTLHSATGGASEWRPPLAWCVAASPESPRHHRRPPQLPERCRAGPRHARRFLRLPQGHNPWASCWRNHLKAGAHAPAMDYVSGSRARASLTTARALQQECRMPRCDRTCRSCTAFPRQPSSTRWSTPRARSAPSRISSESRRGSRMRLKALPAGLWPGACQTAGPKYPGARARHRPRRGVGCQFVSSVSPSLCSTFFSRVSPREPHYIASPRELSCELCAVCPAVRTRCYGR